MNLMKMDGAYKREKNPDWQRGGACFICLCGGRCLVCTLARKNSGQQLTKNVETQKIEKIPDVVREVITDFRMAHMKNLSLGVMRKCRRHFLRKLGRCTKIASSQMIEKAENEKLLSVTQTTQAGQNLKVYQVAVDYGKRQIVYTISLDTENLIAGFYFK